MTGPIPNTTVLDIAPYVGGEASAPGVTRTIRLASNEGALGPSPAAVEAFRAAGTRIALATDCNPGSSPLTSLLLTMNMAATFFRMTVAECLAGVTREAAHALGLQHETGTLEAGKRADLAIWSISDPAELVYRIGFNPLHQRIWRGA